MKVTVNNDACMGCGACTATCPNVFDFDNAEGHEEVKTTEVSESDKDLVVEASESCPTSAISVE